MKTIEVKSCGECPFKVEWWIYSEACFLNSDIEETILPTDKVHENCPLKTESITVKLSKNES